MVHIRERWEEKQSFGLTKLAQLVNPEQYTLNLGQPKLIQLVKPEPYTLDLVQISDFAQRIDEDRIGDVWKEKAWQRRAPSQGRRSALRRGGFCHHWGKASENRS